MNIEKLINKWTSEMSFKYSIRFSGAGGQGLIQAARMVAEAAAIYDDKNAAESCSYGPEARGNASRAEIIISDEAIEYPKAERIDCLVALTQQAYDRYINDLQPEGMIVIDSHIESRKPEAGYKVFSVPLLDIAAKECGKQTMVDIVALGFFAGVNEIIKKTSIQQAILARIPKNSEDTYMKAYDAGLSAAKKMTNRQNNYAEYNNN
ncbi:MAG: 2-oxoacid:ferredoxin oxidoreductase subunit gamma [candidate division Zixibacteria bacterium]|nr:2-oxoacid:ferredoxin oxidoreductase subunit gamma [candidate division Zixibacteria bacterium]